MEPEHIQWDKDDLSDILGDQRDHENPVPKRLSFLYDPLSALGQRVGFIARNPPARPGGHGAWSTGPGSPDPDRDGKLLTEP